MSKTLSSMLIKYLKPSHLSFYGQRKKLESLFCFFDTDGNGVSCGNDDGDDANDEDDVMRMRMRMIMV